MLNLVELYLFIGFVFLIVAWAKGILVNWREIVYCLLAWPLMLYVLVAKK